MHLTKQGLNLFVANMKYCLRTSLDLQVLNKRAIGTGTGYVTVHGHINCSAIKTK